MKYVLFISLALLLSITSWAQARFDANWVLGEGNIGLSGDTTNLDENPWGLIHINFGEEVTFSKKKFLG